MYRKPLLALAVVALFAPVAPIAHADSLDVILSRHYEAEGGLDKLKKCQSMRFTGKMAMGPGMEAPFTLEKKRPAMSRLEFTFSGMTGVQAYDGTQAWQVMPFMGKKDPEPMSADDGKEFADQADFDGPLVDWKAKGHTVEYVGRESVEGADTYKLKLTKKGGSIEYYYLDTETYLVVKEESKRTVRGTEAEVESTLGDYKDVNGMMMPFSMTNGMKGGEHKQAMTFDKIEIDVALADAHFVMPAPPDTLHAAPAAKPAVARKPAAKTTKRK